MKEFLIQNKKPIEKIDSSDNSGSSFKDGLFDFDIVSDTLKHIHTTSSLRKSLSFLLGSFYCYPFLILTLSFLFGFMILGLTALLIFFKLTKNVVNPLLIVSVFTGGYAFFLIILKMLDDRKNPALIAAKWERKNILSNFGLFWTCVLITISFLFMHIFFDEASKYKDSEDIKMIYEYSVLSKELIGSFGYKFLINCFFIEPSSLVKESLFSKVKYYISEAKKNEIDTHLHKDIINFLIPLIILCINKIIKIFILEIKFCFSQSLIYFSSLFLGILIIITSFIPNDYFKISSFIQICLISFIYLGKLTWVIHNSFKFIVHPKDKSFSIRKYRPLHVLAIVIFDFTIIIGATLVFMSLLFFYIAYSHGEENYKNINSSLSFLKVGFLLLAFGNSYYYGHQLLSMLFRPIALQYAPSELKNDHYIRAKRNLLNSLSRRKSGIRMKNVLSRKK